MANEQYSPLDDLVFKALADPTRRAILQALRQGGMPAGAIASLFPISGPSVSRHLAVLRSAGLVREKRDANRLVYSLEGDRLAAVVGSWLSAVCPMEQAAGAQLAPAENAAKGGHKKKGAKSSAKRKRKSTRLDQTSDRRAPSTTLDPVGSPPGTEVRGLLAVDGSSSPGHPGEELA